MHDFIPIEPQARTLRVVAVDDNPGDLELLKHHLTEVQGFEVELVKLLRGSELAPLLATRSFDIAILDYDLKETTGIELFESIRALGHTVPAILLTGQGDEVLVAKAIHAGFSDYMPKATIGHSCLERAMSNALEKHELKCQAEVYRTDLEQSVHDLEGRNREISNFYYTLAHELKTPLTAAREYASLVHDGLAGPVTDQQLEFLKTTMTACDQLGRCIEDLFDVSRIETGKFQVEPVLMRLDEVLPGCVEQKLGSAKEAEIKLVLHSAPRLPELPIDPLRLNQIVGNLLTNAIKFSPAGSTVNVRFGRANDGEQFISVADNGPGIAQEDLERIFERLYQGRGHATVTGGMGLGLHLSRELVRLHGGRLEVESELGKGADFRVVLPAAA